MSIPDDGALSRLLALGRDLLDERVPGVDASRYRVVPELGRGGMGVVYEALDLELDRPVALKVLSDRAMPSIEARQRFVREARAAARLVHPHVAAVYDATDEAIAMQLVRGRTLAESPPETPRLAAAMVRDAALALHAAHGLGIVHRDVKPGNLMRADDRREHVFVMDFGLAKEIAVDSSLSASGLVGTPSFMAPEQAASDTVAIGPSTDVWGLGATLYALLAGRPPHEGQDALDVLRRIADEDPPPLGRIAPRVERDLALIVGRCLEREPARRYPTALALAGDLDRYLRGEPVEARPPSRLYRASRFVGRHRAAFGAGALAVALGAPVLGHAVWKRAVAEEQRAVVSRVLALSEVVRAALRDARQSRVAGQGHERRAHPILEAAAARCERLLEEHDAGHVWFLLGRLRRDQGRFADAVTAFDAAAASGETIPDLPLERGLALAALYRAHVPVLGEEPAQRLELWRRRAAADLSRGVDEHPGPPSADRLFAEGQLAWVTGDVAGAIAAHREVVERDLSHREAHLSLARLYLLEDRDDLAVRHTVVASDLLRGNRPAAVAPTLVWTADGELVPPAVQLLALDGLPELLVDIHAALQGRPAESHVWGFRAQGHIRQALRSQAAGDEAAAGEHLQRAIEALDVAVSLDPDLAAGHVNRGACHAQHARVLSAAGAHEQAARAMTAAAADYDAALAIDPEMAVAAFDRALLHERRAQLLQLAFRPAEADAAGEAARRDARAALDGIPEDTPARERLERLLERAAS